MTISREEALQIARRDAAEAYGDLSRYTVEIQLDSDNWRVDYRLTGRRAGGGPHYLISEKDGSILAKRYEQ
jgi:hypothetical protein